MISHHVYCHNPDLGQQELLPGWLLQMLPTSTLAPLELDLNAAARVTLPKVRKCQLCVESPPVASSLLPMIPYGTWAP